MQLEIKKFGLYALSKLFILIVVVYMVVTGIAFFYDDWPQIDLEMLRVFVGMYLVTAVLASLAGILIVLAYNIVARFLGGIVVTVEEVKVKPDEKLPETEKQ